MIRALLPGKLVLAVSGVEQHGDRSGRDCGHGGRDEEREVVAGR
jgi:hypothetical protein